MRLRLNTLLWIVIFLNMTTFSFGQLLEGIYCGKENCYDVLGVTRTSTRTEIAKAYRKLARKYHPDMYRDPEDKKEAEIKFKIVATAYEILKDDESKTDYDYMLDNPQEYYAHYYRYYKRRSPKLVDVRLVLLVTISIVSIIQYYIAWERYNTAIRYFLTVPKYRNKAMEIVQQRESNGTLKSIASNSKKGKGKLSKTEQKEELEKCIKEIIEENLDIKGSYAKPKIIDVLWIQIILSPITLTKYIFWYTCWTFKFSILKRPYGLEEQLYLIRKNMKMGQNEFNAIEEKNINEYLKLKLWEKDIYNEWKSIQEEELKASLADNAKYKSYRRYMKNHAPSRMVFED